MKHIKIAAGMSDCFDYGKVSANMKIALEAGCDLCHSDAGDMIDAKDLQLLGGHNIVYYVRKISDKPIECHFYSKDCDLLFIEKLAMVGCTMLILPAECFIGAQLADIINWCHERNMKIGLTIGCYSPLSLVEEAIYDIDRLHIDIHSSDKSKNTWRKSSLDLIKRARKMINEKNSDCELSVEGGLLPDNLEAVVECDPDIMVFSSALYLDKEGICEGVKKCRQAIDKAVEKFDLK